MLGSAATLVAVAGAQAADLPSKKAAPATYVKVCDAYGAGFFNIPGTDTCVKVGGYVRAEYQYVPAQDVYNVRDGSRIVTNSVAVAGTQNGGVQTGGAPRDLQDETGFEIRGRIDVDARTPTAMGPARTFVRLRAANTSGVRNTAINNALWNGTGNNAAPQTQGQGYVMSTGSTTGITLESASIQWAGFTFGVAPENYAMMPSHFYNANPWTGFPNGMKQIAYTAQLGGGMTATLALEDRRDMSSSGSSVIHTPSAGWVGVANIRLDQAWGFAAVHGLLTNNSYYRDANGRAVTATWDNTFLGGYNNAQLAVPADAATRSAFAIGSTVSFKLPMIAPGDQVWLTANYTSGMLSALLSDGGLSNVNTAANKRLLGGIVRVDSNIAAINGANGLATEVRNVTGWNVAGAFTHYWASQWRSNMSAGYIQINPPTQTSGNLAWGRGTLQVYTASLIYSPVKDLDIGLETQYANLSSRLQNPVGAFVTAGSPGLNESNWTTKLRVERSF
jgi:hypothetical protein